MSWADGVLGTHKSTTRRARAGYRPRYALDAEDYATAQGFVAAGLGVALVPLLALGAVHSGVAVVRLEGAEPVREVYLATRPAARDLTVVEAMLACLREAATVARSAYPSE